MAPGNSTPVTRPALVVVPAVTGPGSGNTPSPAQAGPVTQAGNTGERVTEPTAGNAAAVTAAPVAAGAVVPMTLPERGRHAVAHWAGIAAEGAGRLWLHPGRVLYVLWHGKPESMAEHRAYVKSRAWVPPELAGKPAAVITAAGIIYHLLVARPVKCAARIVDGAADRPLRLFMLAVFVIPLVFVLLNL